MRIQQIFFVTCLALLLTGTVAADIGTFSFSYNVSSPASDQIDFALTSSTLGTSYTSSWSWISNYVYLSWYESGYGYTSITSYTWEWRSSATMGSAGGYPYSMQLASNFSFSSLAPGIYWYYVAGYAFGYTYPTYTSTSDYSYAYGAFALADAIPTVGQIGLMLFGLALAATGAVLLRRG